MHPEIHASKPGKCPKCGMDLEKQNLLKKAIVQNKLQKQLLRKQEPKTNGVRSRKKLKICIKS
jgi:hypothetical protein